MEGWWGLQDITGLRVTMNPNAVQNTLILRLKKTCKARYALRSIPSFKIVFKIAAKIFYAYIPTFNVENVNNFCHTSRKQVFFIVTVRTSVVLKLYLINHVS